MNDEIAISVSNVSKNFKLPHQNNQSVKSYFLNMLSLGHKGYEMQHALSSVSFDIKEGEFFGIVGRNGSGKSTLLKMLAGIYQPTHGSIQVKGRLVPFIELGVGFNPELTGRENVYLNGALLGFSDREIDAKYRSIVEFAEIERFMDQKLKNYSSGMQVRLAFSVATVLAESDILLIDEVLAVGDADFQRKCFAYFKELKKLKKTVILVTHDMDVVREFCERGVLISKGKVAYSGSAQDIAREYLKLFAIDNETKMSNKDSSNNRWGSGLAKYTSVDMTRTENAWSLDLEAKTEGDIDSPIFGFVIKGPDGKPVMGTNSLIKKSELKKIIKGQKINLRWTFPDILSNGQHTIDIAITQNDGATVHDWWDSAVSFEVNDKDKNPYNVSPPIELRIS